LGNHGCGKTERICKLFNDNKLNWVYFSGSTVDPWIDFIGIPTEDKHGKLKFLTPSRINEDLEAICIDEYNRSPKEVKNALMELIQFKSINGMKFPKLKVVWAAANPPKDDEDETAEVYDVEEIDPAQLDRFHCIVNIPNTPCSKYFRTTYGDKGSAAVEWWNKQPKEFKREVSPRRLAHAIETLKNGREVRYVLPKSGNIADFVVSLTTDPYQIALNAFKEKPSKATFTALRVFNKVDDMEKLLDHESNFIFAELIEPDLFSKIFLKNSNFRKVAMILASSKYSNFDKMVDTVVKAHAKDTKLKKEVSHHATIISTASIMGKDLTLSVGGESAPRKELPHKNIPDYYINVPMYDTAERDRFLKQQETMHRSGYVVTWNTQLERMLKSLTSYQMGTITGKSVAAKIRRKNLYSWAKNFRPCELKIVKADANLTTLFETWLKLDLDNLGSIDSTLPNIAKLVSTYDEVSSVVAQIAK